VAYSIAKFGMSLCTLGHAAEFKSFNVAVNSLWPVTTIDTAAVRAHLKEFSSASRTPEIMADAAHVVLSRPSGDASGRFFLDEEVLRSAGVADFSRYAVNPSASLMADYFVDDSILERLPTRFSRLE
jgi:citronellol/citronellal dehydrogenase